MKPTRLGPKPKIDLDRRDEGPSKPLRLTYDDIFASRPFSITDAAKTNPKGGMPKWGRS